MDPKIILFQTTLKDASKSTERDFALQEAYTNDLNSVQIVFELTDVEAADLTGATASILLYMRDGSFFQSAATISGNKIIHDLTEQEGNHAGPCRVQALVTTATAQIYPTKIRQFNIVSGLDTTVAAEVMIQDWTALTQEARAFIDTAEADEALRVSAESTRLADEALRVSAESARLTAEAGRASAEAARQTGYSAFDGRITDLEAALKHIPIESWADVQKVVRDGVADKIFTIGDQFTAQYAGVDYLWDVIGIDHDEPADPAFTHSLTVQAHDCLMNCVFDAAELLYFAESELPPGQYYFHDNYNNADYNFTTALSLPVGGSIVVSTWGASNDPTGVKTYNAAGALVETLTVTVSSAGIPLTCNDLRRVRYGSNNYLQSNVRNWLNSDAVTYVPEKSNKYDVLTTGAPYNTGGFLKNLDPDLRAVIGPVKKQVAKNTVTDGGGQDLMEDTAFLLSRTEVYGGAEGVTTGESAYPYYSMLAPAATAAELAGRIKYLSGVARYWWLRSPNVAYSNYPRTVYPSGYVSNGSAINAYGLAPACTIY